MRGKPQYDGFSATIALTTHVVISSPHLHTQFLYVVLLLILHFWPLHAGCCLWPAKVVTPGASQIHIPNVLAAPSLTLYDQFPGHSFTSPRFLLLQLELTPVLDSCNNASIPGFDRLCIFNGSSTFPGLNPSFFWYQFYTPQLHHPLCIHHRFLWSYATLVIPLSLCSLHPGKTSPILAVLVQRSEPPQGRLLGFTPSLRPCNIL